MRSKMRSLFKIGIFTIVVGLLGLMNPSWAQEKFPIRPIELLYPWPPGSSDVFVRALQPRIEKILGQPMIINYKPGSGGQICYTQTVNAKPDGYTIGAASPGLVINAHTTRDAVDYRKLDPLILTQEVPLALLVRADSPWQSVKDFIQYAKSNPKKIRIGNLGFGTSNHLTALGLELATGTKFTHMPFKGGHPVGLALLGGHIEAGLPTLTVALPHIRAGKIRALAITSEQRLSLFPDVPTLVELGMPDLTLVGWNGFLGPRGIPESRKKLIQEAVKRSMEESENYLSLIKEMSNRVNCLVGKDYARYLEKLDTQVKKIVEYGGLKVTQ